MSLPAISVRNPVFAWMMMAGFILFGAICVNRLGVGALPDIDIPIITVTVTREGAAPEIMESEVVDEVENAVMQVEGIKEVKSFSKLGTAVVQIEFEINRDINIALQDVQAKVAAAQKQLPKDIDPPITSKTNTEENPLMWLAVTGTRSPLDLAMYAKNSLRDRFLTVEGDGDVRMGGFLDRNARIWIDPDRLIAHGLTVDDVILAVQRQHVEGPAGRIESAMREANVRIEGEALSVEEMRQLVISQDLVHPVRLQDVALVEDGFEDRRRLSRVDGMPAQGMGIIKQHGANSVQLADDCRKRVAELNKSTPNGMQLSVRADNTRAVKEAIANTEETLIHAALLTALVCWLFLGSFSSTFNVLLAIPVSVFGTFAVMYMCGFSLNTFTLLALSLSIGIVVDDAVMVLENIYRHAEMGKDRVTAAREGAEQITFSALAATLSIVAIFLPVAFMSGLIGKFFFQFGVVLSVAVMISLLEALTLAPARCAQFLVVAENRNFIERGAKWVFDGITGVYRSILRVILLHRPWGLPLIPIAILLVSTGLFLGSLKLFPLLGKEMVPAQDQGVFMLKITTPVGSTIDYTNKVLSTIEDKLNQRPELESLFTVVGINGTDDGICFITMKPREERKITQQQVINELRTSLNIFPGTDVLSYDFSTQGLSNSRQGSQVDFSIRGPGWDKLGELSNMFKDEMRKSNIMTDISSDYRVGMPEVQVIPNRERALAHNVDVQSLSDAISALVGGNKIARFTNSGRRYDVRLRLLRDERFRPEDIGNLYVRSTDLQLVKIADVCDVQVRPSLPAIYRISRERAVSLNSNPLPGFTQRDAMDKVEQIAKEKLPDGYKIVWGGNARAQGETFFSLLFALAMGIIVAYMILASQFNSFLHPFTVLLALPFSISGALAALYITHMTINIYSMIGVILLMGLVKKNSIMLVDFTNQLRKEGVQREEALLQACPMRMRAILMTTGATIAGAIPGAVATGAGAELRMPMAMAIIGGLLVSTVLTLIVVPCFYSLSDECRDHVYKGVGWFWNLFGKHEPRVALPHGQEVPRTQEFFPQANPPKPPTSERAD